MSKPEYIKKCIWHVENYKENQESGGERENWNLPVILTPAIFFLRLLSFEQLLIFSRLNDNSRSPVWMKFRDHRLDSEKP